MVTKALRRINSKSYQRANEDGLPSLTFIEISAFGRARCMSCE